jgi:flagellar biogenesis protein FliO
MSWSHPARTAVRDAGKSDCSKVISATCARGLEGTMDLVMLVLVLAIIGFAVWLITTKVPMDPNIKLAIQLLAFVIILIYVLRRLNFLPNVL